MIFFTLVKDEVGSSAPKLFLLEEFCDSSFDLFWRIYNFSTYTKFNLFDIFFYYINH